MEFPKLPDTVFRAHCGDVRGEAVSDSSSFEELRARNSMLRDIEFVGTGKDPYNVHLGKPVRVSAPQGDELGYYQGSTGEALILQPCVMGESSNDASGKEINVQVLDQRPCFIPLGGPGSIVKPLRECYLDYMITLSRENLGRLGLLELESHGSGI